MPKVMLEGEDLTIPEELKKLIEDYGREINIETVGDEGSTSGSMPPTLTKTLKPDINADETEIQYLTWKAHLQRHKDNIYSDGAMNMHQLFRYMHFSQLYLAMPYMYIYNLYKIFLTIPVTTSSEEVSRN